MRQNEILGEARAPRIEELREARRARIKEADLDVESADDITPGFVTVRPRAPRLAPDDRRDAILSAVIPLLRAHGREVSSKDLAEAAGVAEGTLFRAFGDKESIIQAALDRVLDPLPMRTALRGIALDLPASRKVDEVLRVLRERFTEVGSFLAALGMVGGPPRGANGVPREENDEWLAILQDLFAGDEATLTVPVDTLAYYLRLVAFASSISPLNRSHRFTPDELFTLVTRGVIAH